MIPCLVRCCIIVHNESLLVSSRLINLTSMYSIYSLSPVDRGELEKVCLCLALVYAVNLMWTFQTTVRNSVEVDYQMAAVQRVC